MVITGSMPMSVLVEKQSHKFQTTEAIADGSLNAEFRLADNKAKYFVFSIYLPDLVA
jgi:hypothetical protein